MLTVTEFNSKQTPDFREAQGWFLVSLCLFTVFVNFCNLLILSLITASMFILKKYRLYLEKKRKIKIQEDATYIKSTDNSTFYVEGYEDIN